MIIQIIHLTMLSPKKFQQQLTLWQVRPYSKAFLEDLVF
jgi:hypothetical protein